MLMNHSLARNQLEQALVRAGVDLYLVPMADEFQSEYIPACAARLPFLTGFDGSAGFGAFWARPTQEKKHTLFVDGRYTLQAETQVNAAEVALINSGEVSFRDWLEKLEPGLTIGFDSWLITQEQIDSWRKATEMKAFTWVAHSPNLVDAIWDDQPAPPMGEVKLHPHEFAGASYAEKRAILHADMAKHGADVLLLTQPDSINWLLNIRGNDVAYNPLLLAHLVLKAEGSATLYMHPHELSAEVKSYLDSHTVNVASLSDVFSGKLGKKELGKKLMLDAATTAVGWFVLAEKAGVDVVKATDPAALPKATKNTTELAGIRNAHQRDGLALSKFLCWFDAQCEQGKYPDEIGAATRLAQFRAESDLYRGPSFSTIAGSGPNGAIVHYRADEQSNRRCRVGELFLLDSGGQYPDGTTDVTRTLFVSGPSGGTGSHAMRDHFTRVLKGHIALASVKFPVGTSGIQLDVLARQYLWESGLDYDHGTGHGVGAYLCVHEGPQRISKKGSTSALLPGMILSNEPGYYATGHYGIRIESLLAVVEVPKPDVGAKPMLAFETLTLAPIDTRLVEISMLTAGERNWLNAYHRRVYQAHAAQMNEDERRWLTRATRAI